jgi:hypothetical protein
MNSFLSARLRLSVWGQFDESVWAVICGHTTAVYNNISRACYRFLVPYVNTSIISGFLFCIVKLKSCPKIQEPLGCEIESRHVVGYTTTLGGRLLSKILGLSVNFFSPWMEIQRAILNFTPWPPEWTSPLVVNLAPRGEICPLGGMFTPLFTPRGEHSTV